MAYDEVLAERVRERLEPDGVVARKMFGGITFLFQGNALADVYDEGLMVRVGPDGMETALAHPGAGQSWCRCLVGRADLRRVDLYLSSMSLPVSRIVLMALSVHAVRAFQR